MTVYFIKADQEGSLVKIGMTTNLTLRLKTLQVYEKERLKVLGMIDGDRATEIFMHGVFAQYREAGEWFRYEGDLKRYLEAKTDEERTFTLTLPALEPSSGPARAARSYEERMQELGEKTAAAWAELKARPDFAEIMAHYDRVYDERNLATKTDE